MFYWALKDTVLLLRKGTLDGKADGIPGTFYFLLGFVKKSS